MQFGDFFFDGDKRKIYEAPTGFSYTLDGDGYRIYTPIDPQNAPIELQFSTYELWSRSNDYLDSNKWAELVFDLDGGAFRYTDQFNEDKFSLIDLRFINDWSYVPCNYRHNTYIKGNLFPNKLTNIDFDTDRVTIQGVSPRIFFSDAGERSVADSEAQAVANASLVYSSFVGAVWLDSINGYSDIGTDTKPNGNQERPVNSATLALEVCNTRGFRTINVLENYTFTLGDDISKKKIVGDSHITTNIDIGYEAICDEAIFSNVAITGILDGKSEINNSVATDIVYFDGHIHNSSLGGRFTLGGNRLAKFVNCSMASFDNPLILDCGGSGQDCIIEYKGVMSISNLTGANTIGLSMGGGIVTIDADCTAGIIIIQGNFEVVDNSSDGCTVIIDEKTMVHTDIEDIAIQTWLAGTRTLTDGTVDGGTVDTTQLADDIVEGLATSDEFLDKLHTTIVQTVATNIEFDICQNTIEVNVVQNCLDLTIDQNTLEV